MFAAAPVERTTNANKKGSQRRDLSENFLSKINNNNLAEQVKPKAEQDPTKKKEERPRSSVIDNIAMFQGNIDKSTGRTKPDSQNDVKVKRVNVVSCANLTAKLMLISNDYLITSIEI